ncbi:hypothetical protein EJB05_40811 [Eragrostis curvula]|uniref:Rx N-terminal domain-containing protein n=1 Tax=Eragrostis curvula TaxID=38414 RepID=A0A5J9TPJ1_9POAL|nr:hypothetical protein EJB05_40811 [Eragrostis curvula]
MAETSLSIARSILGSAISKAASAATEEMSLLMGVQKEIWFMKDELKTMQAFLIAAEAMKKKDLLLKVWAEQVRSLSYDIEDCFDEFMVHVGNQSLSQQLMKLKDRHRIAVQIRNLKSRVEEVSSRNTRYRLITTKTTKIDDEAQFYMEDVRNHSATNIDEAELVGFSNLKKELLDMINAQHSDDQAQVICVVGTGGLGKATVHVQVEHLGKYIVEGLKEKRKMRKSKEDMESNEKLKIIVIKLVKKCGGLPLAIVTIGAMFASKHISEWDKLYEQLPSELEIRWQVVVTLSYNHLPSYLKPCFLYLSIFPKDSEIRRRRLVDRWIADGLVRARVEMTSEDVGKSCFNELLSRSMIQPSRVNLEGVVKSCRVHDIMRDIIVTLSRDEGFVYTSADNVPGLVEENFRHVACHGSKCSTVGMDWSRVRSLTLFGERPMEHGPPLSSPKLRMLRALDLENADFGVTQKELNKIGLLRHLKYIKFSMIKLILRSAMERLLNYTCWSETSAVKVPRRIGNLKELQILETVDIKRTCGKAIRELGELSKLRKLSVNTEEATEKKCRTLCKAIQKLSSLGYLWISAGDYRGTIEWLDSVSSPPPLRTLALFGHKVDWFRNLTQLVKLRLYGSALKEGKTVEILGALPHLMLLNLGRYAYDGKELVFRQGAFLNLRKLTIEKVYYLGEIRFEQDAVSQMESIEIEDCRLELGINGITRLPNVKDIFLDYECKVARLGMLEEELSAHPNQPGLRLAEDRSKHDLGDAGGPDEY